MMKTIFFLFLVLLFVFPVPGVSGQVRADLVDKVRGGIQTIQRKHLANTSDRELKNFNDGLKLLYSSLDNPGNGTYVILSNPAQTRKLIDHVLGDANWLSRKPKYAASLKAEFNELTKNIKELRQVIDTSSNPKSSPAVVTPSPDANVQQTATTKKDNKKSGAKPANGNKGIPAVGGKPASTEGEDSTTTNPPCELDINSLARLIYVKDKDTLEKVERFIKDFITNSKDEPTRQRIIQAAREKSMGPDDMVLYGLGLCLFLLGLMTGYFIKQFLGRQTQEATNNSENNALLTPVNKAPDPPPLPPALPSPTEKSIVTITPQLLPGKYFFAEVMSTAGPRKDEDHGLGEDVAGLILREDYALFWILDGVSNYSILLKNRNDIEYFSSRMLAQSIAWHVQHMIGGHLNNDSYDLQNYLEKAKNAAIADMRARLGNLDESERYDLLNQLKSGKKLIAATTVMLGWLTKQGDLSVCQIGVDKFVALPNGQYINPKTDKNFKSGRVAIQIEHDNNALFINEFMTEPEAIHTYFYQGVSTVVAASDGVSDNVFNWLKNQPQPDFQNPQLRQSLAMQRGETFDDKALCIIQIKNI